MGLRLSRFKSGAIVSSLDTQHLPQTNMSFPPNFPVRRDNWTSYSRQNGSICYELLKLMCWRGCIFERSVGHLLFAYHPVTSWWIQYDRRLYHIFNTLFNQYHYTSQTFSWNHMLNIPVNRLGKEEYSHCIKILKKDVPVLYPVTGTNRSRKSTRFPWHSVGFLLKCYRCLRECTFKVS